VAEVNGLKFSTSEGLPLSPWMVSVPPVAELSLDVADDDDEQALATRATRAAAAAQAMVSLGGLGGLVIVVLLI
jgi:hypothetical protein